MDRKIIVEVSEDDYWDIIRFDGEAPSQANIEYRVRKTSESRFIPPSGKTRFGNGSQMDDDEGKQAA